jgi:hypothetical protein
MAPEHVHERDGDHEHTLAHRHFAPHHLADSHDHAAFEAVHDHAGRVIWLNAVSLHQVTYQLELPSATLTAAVSVRPPAVSWVATSLNDAAPPHGSPRLASTSRGPPAFPPDLT